jgi:site-specific recombinase XerD
VASSVVLVAPSFARPVSRVKLALPSTSPAGAFLLSQGGGRKTQLHALRVVAEWFGSSLAAFDWASLTFPLMNALRTWLGETYAPTTANRMLTAVRGVIRCAAKLRLMSREDALSACEIDPVRGSRLPAGRALTPEELAALVAVAPDAGRRPGVCLRSVAAFALCYGAGLRRAEAVGLTTDRLLWIDAEGRYAVRIVGKGNKERDVTLPSPASQPIRRWMLHRGDVDGAVLCRLDKHGNAHPEHFVDETQVWRWFEVLARQAGVSPFSPHDLRRTFASNLFDADVHAGDVQALMGHADLTTTMGYDRRPKRRLVAVAAKLPFPELGEKGDRPRGGDK